MGPVRVGTREHLGQSDKAISVYRRILRSSIEQAVKGERTLMVLDPSECAGHHRSGLRRRHSTCRRLAGLLAEGARKHIAASTRSWANGH